MRKRDDETLVRMANEHLYYELQILQEAPSFIPDQVIQKVPTLLFALIECSTVHMRVLLDFFFNKLPKESDLVATDYFDNPEDWWALIESKFETSKVESLRKTLRNRVNWEVVHLTTHRLEVEADKKSWKENLEDATTIIRTSLRTFLLAVEDKRLGPLLTGVKKTIKT